MQALTHPVAIKYSTFPRREGNYTLAAWFDYELDLLAKYLGVKPYSYTTPDRYRVFFLRLPNDRYATLSQTERKKTVEIGLRLYNDRILDEVELNDVLSILPRDIGNVQKIDNGFVWVPAA